MIIGIDGNEANVERKVGVSEFAYQLLYYLHSFKKEEKINHSFVIYLKTKPNKSMPEEFKGWEYRVARPSRFWTQFALPFNLYFGKKNLDVFFSPTHYAPRFCPFPTIVSVMDTSYLHFPDLFKKRDLYQLMLWTAYSVKKASQVVTISLSSKRDIIEKYQVAEDKVKVIYLGIKQMETLIQEKNKVSEIKQKYNISHDYVLFVGTLQPRKNIRRLIEAFSKLEDKKIDLVIVGKKGWLYEEILSAPTDFQVKDRVKFLDFVSDEDLPVLYSNALCYILPSLYEGFGLPVLEAMKYGCPVITSNISSLPEAGGEAAIYCNPEDVNDISEKIEYVLKHKDIREKMIKKGYEQVKKFSWEKAANEALSILEKVGKNKKS